MMAATMATGSTLVPMPDSLKALHDRLLTLVSLGTFAQTADTDDLPDPLTLEALGLPDAPDVESVADWAAVYTQTLVDFESLAANMVLDWQSLTGEDVRNIEEALAFAEAGLKAWVTA